MNCKQIQNQIKSSLVHSDKLSNDGHLSAHLAHCDTCNCYASDLLLQKVLQQIETPTPTKGFINKAISSAIESNKENHSKKSFAYYPLPIAVSFFAVCLVFFFAVNTRFNNHDSISIVLEPQQQKDIRILIESSKDRSNVQLSVTLADNLQVAGYTHQKTLTWRANLEKGNNLITLPLTLKNWHSSEFEVKYRHKNHLEKIHVAVTASNTKTNKHLVI